MYAYTINSHCECLSLLTLVSLYKMGSSGFQLHGRVNMMKENDTKDLTNHVLFFSNFIEK